MSTHVRSWISILKSLEQFQNTFIRLLSTLITKITQTFPFYLNRGSCMTAHVLLILLNKLGKEIKCQAYRAFYLFFATSLINSIIQEQKC